MAIETADDEFFSCLTEQQLATYKTLTILLISKGVIKSAGNV
jgi:hypothetical protein